MAVSVGDAYGNLPRQLKVPKHSQKDVLKHCRHGRKDALKALKHIQKDELNNLVRVHFSFGFLLSLFLHGGFFERFFFLECSYWAHILNKYADILIRAHPKKHCLNFLVCGNFDF